MASKKLPPDHPQKRPKRTRKRVIPPCPWCGKRTTDIHTCYDATATGQVTRYPNVDASQTAGTLVVDTVHITGIPCVDESQHTALYDYAGPERRTLDPFWMHLAADMFLARQRFYRWVRNGLANGLSRVSVRLMRLAARIAAVLCVAVPSLVAGQSAYQTGEVRRGATTDCFYAYAGKEYTRTVESYQLCPLRIDVTPRRETPPPGISALYTGQRVTGLTRQCFYVYAGRTYTRTVERAQLCPLRLPIRP